MPRPRIKALHGTREERSGRFLVSSTITSVEYDDEARELDITFTSGKKYRYFNVPLEILCRIMDAGSKGKFFNDNIKRRICFSLKLGKDSKRGVARIEVKRIRGRPRGMTPDFAFAQSGLLPRSDDKLISLDPELRAGAVEIAFGEEGVEQRFVAALAPRYLRSNAQARRGSAGVLPARQKACCGCGGSFARLTAWNSR